MNPMRLLKWLGIGILSLLVMAGLVLGAQLFRFSRARAQVYTVAPLDMTASSDSQVLARGRHIAESFGGCTGCHGPGLGGRQVEDLGPIGVMRAPNLTRGRGGVGGVGGAYTDGQLARAIRHGIGSDDQTLLFMPTPEHHWWPDSDVQAVVSFVRSVPNVDNEVPPTEVRPLGRLLDQFGVLKTLSARMVDHDAPRAEAPAPEPTPRYGALLARSCTGCHGDSLGGGPIPGAPSSLPVPANLTAHATGLATWTKEQFVHALQTGVRPDGRQLNSFMPIATTATLHDVEYTALWEYLRSLPPREFGQR